MKSAEAKRKETFVGESSPALFELIEQSAAGAPETDEPLERLAIAFHISAAALLLVDRFLIESKESGHTLARIGSALEDSSRAAVRNRLMRAIERERPNHSSADVAN